MKKIIPAILAVLMIFSSTAAVYAAAPADGTYSVATTLQGGSGRTSIKSPSTLTVSGGKMQATVVFNSTSFTWMKVNGVTYNNSNSGGNSTFTIPVSALDTGISVSAETVAMSEPHVIDYVLTFSSAGVTMQGQDPGSNNSGSSSQGGQTSSGSDTSTDSGKGAVDSDADSDAEDKDTEKEVVVDDSDAIEINNTMSNFTSVSEDMLSDSDGKTMSLETALGRVDFDEDATAAIAKAAKGGITLAMSDVTADFEDRGYAIAVSISLEDGEGNDLAEAASMGNITVTLNLDEDMEIENSLVVYALDGEEESQIEADVDADSRAVTFDASTLGTFAVDNGAAMGSATVYVAIGIVIAATVIGGIAYFVVRGKKKK